MINIPKGSLEVRQGNLSEQVEMTKWAETPQGDECEEGESGGSRVARWSLRPFCDPSRHREHCGNGNRDKSQNCRCSQVLGASKTASLDLGRVPCDMLVTVHALCLELGWPGTAVGPAGLV